MQAKTTKRTNDAINVNEILDLLGAMSIDKEAEIFFKLSKCCNSQLDSKSSIPEFDKPYELIQEPIYVLD